MLAGEHRIAARLEPDRARQIGEQPQRLAVDPVLAVVDVEVTDGQRQFPAAFGIRVEELPQMGVTDLLVMTNQRRPSRRLCDLGNHVLDLSE